MQIDLNGASIFFDVVGAKIDISGSAAHEKETLLVLHGGPGADHTSLRPYFDRFADTYQVIYLDHRGCGRSSGDPSTWHLDQWADDIDALCTTLGIQKPIVLGQSFGGMVAMHFAARYPDKVSKLVLSSTAAQFRLDATVKMVTQLGGKDAAQVADRFFSTPTLAHFDEYMRVCMPLYSPTQTADGHSPRKLVIERPEVTVHFFRNEMMGMDLRPEIAGITCPTLVLGGALDPVTPVVCSEEIAKAVGDNATLNIFEGCGHGVFRDDPDGAETVLRTFFASG